MSHPQSERVVAVIPARLGSTRLPRKVLRELAGKPMVGLVYEAVARCPQFAEVLIATDSSEVAAYASAQGWPSMMTSPELASGTDRVHAVAGTVHADIYVNIQGDEPMVEQGHIDALLRPFALSSAEVTTLSTPCSADEVSNPNAVKVVTATDGRALYFSRSPIPYHRGDLLPPRKHLGLYAYRKAALQRFASLPPSPLERAERLEQLRMLENGMSVFVEHVLLETIGVDTEEDLQAAERALQKRFLARNGG